MDEDDDIILVESGGVIIRVPAKEISVHGRVAMGVRIMRIEGDGKVVGLQSVKQVDTNNVEEFPQETNASQLLPEELSGETEE